MTLRMAALEPGLVFSRHASSRAQWASRLPRNFLLANISRHPRGNWTATALQALLYAAPLIFVALLAAQWMDIDYFILAKLEENGLPVQHDPALGYLNADQSFRFDETIDQVQIVRGGIAYLRWLLA